jgi:hypothetical protein
MSAITVVTTFHPAGLTKYGQRFLDSFATRVDKRIKLLVYAEDCKPNNPDPNRIEIIDAKQALPKLNAFKEKYKKGVLETGIKNSNGMQLGLLTKLMLCLMHVTKAKIG